MPKRKEFVWSLQESRPDYPYGPGSRRSSDVTLTFTRQGIEVNAFYDRFVGIGPTVLIRWAEIEAYRQKVVTTSAKVAHHAQ